MTTDPRSTSDEVSDYLLEQFEAIDRFESLVVGYEGLNKSRPGQVKWYYSRGDFGNECLDPYLLELCDELAKVVPADHHYWSDSRGYRYQ